jgi:hypothetical protein
MKRHEILTANSLKQLQTMLDARDAKAQANFHYTECTPVTINAVPNKQTEYICIYMTVRED